MVLIKLLEKASGPLTVEEVHARGDADLVTVYRNLQSLAEAGLVREVRFKDAKVRYELAQRNEHHHHLVCTGCGTVDELPECDITKLEKNALKHAKRFVNIEEHSLEFFGRCKSCAR
jgi:Fur family ferric uptake transcriptional regulator